LVITPTRMLKVTWKMIIEGKSPTNKPRWFQRKTWTIKPYGNLAVLFCGDASAIKSWSQTPGGSQRTSGICLMLVATNSLTQNKAFVDNFRTLKKANCSDYSFFTEIWHTYSGCDKIEYTYFDFATYDTIRNADRTMMPNWLYSTNYFIEHLFAYLFCQRQQLLEQISNELLPHCGDEYEGGGKLDQRLKWANVTIVLY
jgi:hypothetical protein